MAVSRVEMGSSGGYRLYLVPTFVLMNHTCTPTSTITIRVST